MKNETKPNRNPRFPTFSSFLKLTFNPIAAIATVRIILPVWLSGERISAGIGMTELITDIKIKPIRYHGSLRAFFEDVSFPF